MGAEQHTFSAHIIGYYSATLSCHFTPIKRGDMVGVPPRLGRRPGGRTLGGRVRSPEELPYSLPVHVVDQVQHPVRLCACLKKNKKFPTKVERAGQYVEGVRGLTGVALSRPGGE